MSNFFNLPRELRDQIYELCLVHHEPLRFDGGYWGQKFGAGLLRTSKTTHHEASALFYSHNHFDFTFTTSEKATSFLETIGHNAVTSAMKYRLERLDHPKIVTDALELVDTHFRAGASLQKVIVEMFEEESDGDIRRKMESHGWTVMARSGSSNVYDIYHTDDIS
ncbi:hypothetical protein BX600DRAFT_506967 [Xylariales sp. PMI_506]|nr:hypothetical protein BX600DRAFT_506967 [Xylariales sp. PMI_506]